MSEYDDLRDRVEMLHGVMLFFVEAHESMHSELGDAAAVAFGTAAVAVRNALREHDGKDPILPPPPAARLRVVK